MKNVIDWFEIPVRDMPRAQVFYETVLQSTLQRVVAAGGQVAMGPVALPEGLGFMAHILDVDGNRVGLHAYA
jgi:predicted enzyme related to lactoylglutathione lyase